MTEIKIDLTRDNLLTEQSKVLLKDYYMTKDEKSPQECYARASKAYCYGDFELAQRIYDYASKNWFMFSSPILSNAPAYGEKPKALPISCYLNFVEDTLHDIIEHSTETRWLSVKGGGVGGHWSKVRSQSSKSPGIMPFLHTIDSDMVAYTQASTRKGSYAAYLDVNNSDIMEFITMRTPTGGDINRKNLNLHHGINISDDFMNAVKNNEDFDLICPHSKEVKETVSARKLWQKILETRYRTGEPYLHFIDTANRALPQEMKDKGLRINGSNLCLTGNTQVTIRYADGVIERTNIALLSDIYKKNDYIEILSYDINTNKSEFKFIENCGLTNDNADIILLGIPNNNSNYLHLTPEQRYTL